jgi:hypothetical protein
MIDNESLFDSFRRNRSRGYRNAWVTPTWAQRTNPAVGRIVATYTLHGLPEPPETLTEVDMAVPGSNLVACPECDLIDYEALLYDGICATCAWERERDWRETMAMIGG